MTAFPTFVPYYDRLLLKRVEEAGNTQIASFGFALTDAQKEKPLLYEVVAVGGGHLTEMGHVVALQSLPGDRVLVGKYAGAGAEIKLNGEEYITCRENEVLGRVSRRELTAAKFDVAAYEYEAVDGSFTIENAAIVSVTELHDTDG
jgi:co-chaperonin GroES (HSP10)